MLIRGLVLLAIVAAILAGYVGWRDHQRAIGAAEQRVIDQAEVNQIKLQARSDLNAAVKAKEEAEKRLQAAADAQGVKDAKNARHVADLAGRLSALAGRNNQRLRDPFSQPGGCGGGGGRGATEVATAPSAGTSDAAETDGLLSAELTGFLQQQAKEADEVNNAYASCRETLMLGLGGAT